MIRVPSLSGKRVVVMGLGKSGTATCAALRLSGAEVTAWDDTPTAREAASASGVTVTDPLTDSEGLSGVDLLIWSPGIPSTYPLEKAHPLAAAARAAKVKLVCDVELLAFAKPGNRFLAITGTNGKSTTTTLLAHLLAHGGRESAAGGNLGTAALDMPDLSAEGRYVLELSSYQLELIETLRLQAGALLNITPDHLGRHGGLAGYIKAKRLQFDLLAPEGTAIIGVDDAICAGIATEMEQAGRTVVRISAAQTLGVGISAADGILRDDGHEVCDLRGLVRLPGRHNWQNACAAYALARADGLESDVIAKGLMSYPGLAHRQELVAEVGGVAYINDSKATNADAVEKALVCHDRIYWILGGQAKEGGIQSLEAHFPRIVHAFLIGEAAEAFARTLNDKNVPYTLCGDLATAVTAARAMAKSGTVVLLSPACASWDQFKSFEHRGEVFRHLVEDLR